MAYLKNIPFEDPFRMADQVSVLPGQVVSIMFLMVSWAMFIL